MKKGFTLIELLIVIAIIAILALIAVPNFLEAQVRAKVSRCYADMRSIAVALEAYCVDWGRGPICGSEFLNNYPDGKSYNEHITLSPLTTPMAFIASIPLDPFTMNGGYTNPDGTHSWTRRPYNYRWIRLTGTETNPVTSWNQQMLNRGYIWWFFSFGPSRTRRDQDDPDVWISPNGALLGLRGWLYDSTNGTMSRGLIILTNKGFEGRQSK